jgi:hypothetical protein
MPFDTEAADQALLQAMSTTDEVLRLLLETTNGSHDTPVPAGFAIGALIMIRAHLVEGRRRLEKQPKQVSDGEVRLRAELKTMDGTPMTPSDWDRVRQEGRRPKRVKITPETYPIPSRGSRNKKRRKS